MSNDTQLILDIWDTVRDILPTAKRVEVANGILRAFSEYGFEARDISAIADEDSDLEEAYYEIFYEGDYPMEDEDDQ